MTRTRVYITVDTECAEERLVRGVVQPPQGYEVSMWGRFRKQREELGIGLIMRELEACGFRGTFFVETFCREVFGTEGLAAVCGELHSRGHDVQLHLHPNMKRPPGWRERGIEPIPDNIGEHPLEGQTAYLREGIDILAECGVPRAGINSFRAGNYGADNRTWTAMAAAGLTVSSNYNASYVGRSCRLDLPRLEGDLFRTDAGVWELPVSNFRQHTGVLRHLEISAVSVQETVHHLWQARRLGIGHVTLVTHPPEFFHIDSAEAGLGRPNRVNIGRLRGICRFLKRHGDDFEVETVGVLAQRLLAAPCEARHALAVPEGKRSLYYPRLVQQAYKRLEEKLAF